MTKWLLSIVIIAFLFVGQSCQQLDDYSNSPERINGYVPVYMEEGELISQVKSLPPRNLKNTGRVYLYKDYMLVIEKDSGIHVLDNNSSTLESLGFIKVPYVTSLAIKDDVLYVQFGFGLMYIDVSQFPTIQVLGTVKNPGGNSYVNFNQLREIANNPNGTIYFECPEESNQIIVDWIPKRLNKPKCYIQ